MVKGLDRFREHFAGWEDHYVIIGGTAASITMEAVSVPFRATRDLDMVLHVEVLSKEFLAHFWSFVQLADYGSMSVGEGEKPRLYRFSKPVDSDFPYMIELLCRKPDAIEVPEDLRIIPIQVSDSISDLSAILIDDTYYEFILSGSKIMEGISIIGEDRLIPLKSVAWMNLREDIAKGVEVRKADVDKHLNDVFRLSQLLDAEVPVNCPQQIKDDLGKFLTLASENAPDLARIGISGLTVEEVLDRIRTVYITR